MRLIDSDSLKETLDYYIREANWGDEVNKVLEWVKDEFIDSETTVPAIPVSWIEAKITQLISMDNEFAGLTVHIIKTLLNEWKAEQRSPEVDHDAQIRELAEEMSKHGVT